LVHTNDCHPSERQTHLAENISFMNKSSGNLKPPRDLWYSRDSPCPFLQIMDMHVVTHKSVKLCMLFTAHTKGVSESVLQTSNSDDITLKVDNVCAYFFSIFIAGFTLFLFFWSAGEYVKVLHSHWAQFSAYPYHQTCWILLI